MFVSYLLTIDKGGEGFGDPLPLSQRAHIEGQVNPLARGQHEKFISPGQGQETKGGTSTTNGIRGA